MQAGGGNDIYRVFQMAIVFNQSVSRTRFFVPFSEKSVVFQSFYSFLY